MRVARGVLSAFLSMAQVVGMVPDCAYAKVAARALHLGTSQASPSGAGDAQQASPDDVASSGEPAPADTGEVADGDAELQSATPEEGFSYRQVSGGVEVTGYAGDATELSICPRGARRLQGGGHRQLGPVRPRVAALRRGARVRGHARGALLRRLLVARLRQVPRLAGVHGGRDALVPRALRGLGPLLGQTCPRFHPRRPGAFRGCDRLASVEVPDTVTSVDPSGTVVDAATGEPVPGARVTLWYAPLPGVDPEPWDASPWGQENPIATDGGGRFSWEVPEGWWQVRVEAEGYWPAQSEWVRMPAATEPDLQIGLRPASLPQPGGAACADCSVAPGPSARLGRVA